MLEELPRALGEGNSRIIPVAVITGGLAFGPDGERLASWSNANTAKVWDVATGQELVTLHGHTAPPQGIAYSPDSTRIVTAASNGTIRTFVVDNEELVAVARSRVTRSLTTEECQKYLHLEACPGAPYRDE